METSEQRTARFQAIKEDIASQLLEKYPDVKFNRHKYGIDVIYYVAHFSNGVRVSRRKRSINTTVPNLDSYFLSEDAAKQEIGKYTKDAQEKFEKCLRALNKLQASLDFDVSYYVDGDTHGIEEEYQYIFFKMGGFDFTFRIDS